MVFDLVHQTATEKTSSSIIISFRGWDIFEKKLIKPCFYLFWWTFLKIQGFRLVYSPFSWSANQNPPKFKKFWFTPKMWVSDFFLWSEFCTTLHELRQNLITSRLLDQSIPQWVSEVQLNVFWKKIPLRWPVAPKWGKKFFPKNVDFYPLRYM